MELIMKWLAAGAVVFIYLRQMSWVIGNKRLRLLEDEFKRNDLHEAPPDRQLRWDIRHMREDLQLLGIIASGQGAMLLAIALILVFKF
jgi:transposase